MTDEPALNNWRQKSGLLSWGMEIANDESEDPSAMTKRCVIDSARLLADFATVRQVSWSTEAGGEDALIQDLVSTADGATGATTPDTGNTLDVLAAPNFSDLQRVSMNLDLLVRYPVPPIERTLPNEGSIFVEYEHNLGLDANGAARPGVYLNLSLDVDIYARRAYTAASDNQVLADLNAPRLNRYLRALQEHFGARFTYIEYEGERGQIDHNGFIGHDGPVEGNS